MGKSKKRILNKNTSLRGLNLKREEIISQVLSNIRCNNINDDTKNYISLFGITVEEISEAGATFEELSAFKHFKC